MSLQLRPRALRVATGRLWPLGLFLAGLLVAAVCAYLVTGDFSRRLQFGGMVLQFLGTGVFGWNLIKARRDFKLPRFRDWLASCWRELLAGLHRPAPVVLQAGSASVRFEVPHARLSVSAGQDATDEQRLAVLEGRVASLEGELIGRYDELSSDARRVRRDLEKEQELREQQDREIWATLKEYAVGTLPSQWVAFLWILIGNLFSFMAMM